MLRRHLIDGVEKLVLHDTSRAEVVELSAEQLDVLLCCDGTRDLGGVVLATVRRGSYRRISEVEQLLVELTERGLLVDGIEARLDASRAAKPFEVLPGFSLTCNRSGSCCAVYSSVAFIEDDADSARAVCPDAISGPRHFLPLYGSVANGSFATTMVDGACALLGEDGACQVHARAGAERKPVGCRTFPTTYVDDGEAVRVSVSVECACVLESVGKDGGEPLVADAATFDVPGGIRVPVLDATLRIAEDHVGDRAALRSWTDVAIAALRDHDAMAAAWALAAACDAHGLSPQHAKAALGEPEAPAAAAWQPRIEALAATTQARRASANAWRSSVDRARRLIEWTDGAAQELRDAASLQQVLGEVAARTAAHERFYMQSGLFGYRLLGGSLSLAQALRDRATRMLLARRMAMRVPPSCQADPSRDHPLAAVEALMRGQGLESYALELP